MPKRKVDRSAPSTSPHDDVKPSLSPEQPGDAVDAGGSFPIVGIGASPGGLSTFEVLGNTQDITEQKRAKADSNALPRLLQHLNAGVVIHAADTRILFANETASRLLGLTPDQMFGKTAIDPAWSFVREDGTPMPLAEYPVNRILATHQFFQNQVLGINRPTTRDRAWVLVNAYPEFDDARQLDRIVVAFNDITERKLAEEALKASEMRFKELLLNVPTVAVQGYALDGTVRYWNRASETFYGYTAEEALAQNLLDLIVPPALRDGARAAIGQMIATGQTPPASELDLMRKDGSLIPVYSSHALVHLPGQEPELFCIDIDLTERKRAEEAMRLEQIFSQTIIDSIPGPFYVLDERGGYVRWNAYQRDQIIGRTEENTVGFGAINSIHPDDREAIAARIATVLQHGTVETVEGRVLLRGGPAFRWFLMTGRQLVVNGKVFLVGIGIDITERKRAEEEREKLQHQLQQAQKLESVGRLAGGVAHDFNNMLQSILGHAELMQMKGLPTPDLRMDLEEIRKAAQRSAELTRQLLGFARKQPIAPKVLDINQTVNGLLNMLRRLLGEDIELVWKPGPGPLVVKIDPAQIDQILVNLALNARDAITGAGRILLETKPERSPGETGGNYVCLRISDNGCGMSPEVQAQILEPFFTTKPLGKGTGLGLPMVYGMVKQNQGELTFSSEVGKGSVFTVFLPLVQPESAEPSAPVRQTDSPGGRESVLVVEDEPSIRAALVRFLESLGYTACSADSPEQALAMLQNPGLRIALLVTDVVMPGMSGGELVSKARALCPGLKCLHISGYPDDDLSRRGTMDKKIPFLSKPFTRDQLAHKVREALGTIGGAY